MGHIAVNDLKQGMVLNEDVVDINARLLLSKGQKILEKHLRILKIWGVAQVSVVGECNARPAEEIQIDPQKAAMVKSSTDFVFKNLAIHHPVIEELYRSAFLYRCRQSSVVSPSRQQAPANQAIDVNTIRDIRDQIQKIDIKLPEAPTIISDLNAITSDPLATTNDIAQVVQKSPSLASLLLRVVNSAFYGFSSKIDNISRAVTIIGTKEISCLAIGICVMQAFDDIPADVIDMNSFIRHSYASGLISRILAARLNIQQTEQLFVSGLLHDIGKLIVYKYFPQHAKATFAIAVNVSDSVYHAEKIVLGHHHTQIGNYLLKKWKLPVELQDTIVSHHTPGRAKDRVNASLVQMADLIANALGLGHSGEQAIAGFDFDLWDQVKIHSSILPVIIRQALHQLNSMEASLRSS